MTPVRRHYAAVFAISWGLALLELAYARIVSVAMAAHFATAAVSLALLGVGAGALLLRAFPDRFPASAVDRQLPVLAAAFAAAAVLSDVMVLEHVPVPDAVAPHDVAWLALIATCFAVPFAVGGLAVAMLVTHFARHIGPMSAARFAGAGLGCATGVVVLGLLPAPPAPVVVGAAACWTALLFAADAGTSMRLPVAGCVLVALFAYVGTTQANVLHLLHVRRWTQPYTEYDAWNAGARVGVFASAPGTTAAQTLPLSRPADAYTDPRPPEFKWLDVDGTAWTPILRYDGNPEPLGFLRDSVVYAAHHLHHDARVLLVGVGGGRDVLAAIAFGQRTVLGIEPNPLVRDAVERRFGYFSGAPYERPGVRVLVGDVRSALARLDERFDIVQLGADTSGATRRLVAPDGYRYTREAFVEYFRHLAPGGALSVTRVLVPEYPFETARVVATVRAAWAAAGVPDPTRHVVVLAQDLSATVLAKREPFTDDDLAAIDRLSAERRFVVRVDPRRTSDGEDAATLVGADAGALAAAGVDLRPATDDRPFFPGFLHWPTRRLTPDPMGLLAEADAALRTRQAVLLLAVGFAAAVLLGARAGTVAGRAAGGESAAALLLAAFFTLAVACTALETAVVQWLALLLGSPPTALVAGACPLLLGCGVGSVAATRVGASRRTAIGATSALTLAAVCCAVVLPHLVGVLLDAADVVKIGVAAAVAFPPGLLLGAAWTLALATARDREASLVASALGLDGVAVVVATTLVTMVAERLGFTAVLIGAGAMGATAAALLTAATRPAVALEAVPDPAVGS
jgi:hypothetical protein